MGVKNGKTLICATEEVLCAYKLEKKTRVH